MKQDGKANKKNLDDAIQAIRDDCLDPERISGVSEAAWQRITAECFPAEPAKIRNCDDFQSLIPAYLGGRLHEARALLLLDHTRECSACRAALAEARPAKLVHASFEPPADRLSMWMKWGGLAAAVLVGLGLFQIGIFESILPWKTATLALLEDSNGAVFRVLEEEIFPVELDQGIEAGQAIRTARDSGAIVRLPDGSKVEMAERTELALLDGWFGTTIQLKRGHVIVEAVPQGSGRLYVATNDCRVAVKGTVFSVSHGMKGSRVSVIEGEVLVEKGGLKTRLRPGEQFASQPNLSKVSVEEDIAWSGSAEQHLALLREVTSIQRELHQATFGQELRYSSSLLDLLPGGTVVYGAMPNVSGRLKEVYELFMQRIDGKPL